jgi:hypothetical protein
VVLAPFFSLVKRTVFEIADADGRAVAQRVLALRAVVDVAVEPVYAHKRMPILDEFLEIRAPSHPELR